jgi:hypothetical protein
VLILSTTVSAEEIREQKVEEHPLAPIQIPDIEPSALLRVWGSYERTTREYFAKVKRVSRAPSEN